MKGTKYPSEGHGGHVGSSLPVPIRSRTVRGLLRKSEAKYRALVTRMPAVVCEVAPDGTTLFVNETITRATGYLPEDLQGRNWWEIFYPGEQRSQIDDLKAVLAAGDVTDYEMTLTAKDGSPRTIIWNSCNRYLPDGTLETIVGFGVDITEGRLAGQLLEEKNHALRALIQASPAAIISLDSRGSVKTWNATAERIFGWSEHEVLGGPLPTVPEANREDFLRACQSVMLGANLPTLSVPALKKNADMVQVTISLAPVFSASGSADGTVAIITVAADSSRTQGDIDEANENAGRERERERQIAEQEVVIEHSDRFFNLSLDTMAVVGFDGTIKQVNPAIRRVLGYREDELLGERFLDYLHPEDRAGSEADLQVLAIGAPTMSSELRIRCKDGSYRWMVWAVTPDVATGLLFAVGRDITEHKLAEDHLLRLRKAVEASGEVVFLTDRDGLITYINPEFTRIYGHTAEETVGKVTPRILKSGVFPPEAYAGLWQTILNGQTVKGEFVNKTKDGGLLNVEGSANPVSDEQGNIVGFLAIQRDITDRKQAESDLKESEARYRRIVETAMEGVWVIDAEARTTFANNRMAEMLGYTLDEVIGQSLFAFMDEEGRIIAASLLDRRSHGIKEQHDFKFRRKDGSELWALLSATPILDDAGSFVAALAMVTDITERKRAEEKLRKSEEGFRLLVNSSPDMIIEQDRDLRYTFIANPVPPFTADQFIGKTEFDVFCPELAQQIRDLKERVLETGAGTRAELPVTIGSEKHFFEVAYEPRLDAAGCVVGIFGYVRDITEHKLAQAADRRAFERLQKTLEGTIQAMAMTVEMKDPYTAGHQEKVAELATAIGQEMGLSEDELEAIRLAGLIHDIGKIGIPAEILSKPGRMGETEFSLIKAHSQVGYDILKRIEFPWPVAQIVQQHHERMDGSGYPLGLHGDEILLGARVVAVADVVEAIASHRPYRPALGVDHALAFISQNRGALFDPLVVDACLRLFANEGHAIEGTTR